MALVLCMAGLWRRFRDAGYTTPKYLLPYQGRPILAVIAEQLPASRVLMIANERERAFADDIRAAVPGAELLFVGDTAGQADTAAIGAEHLLAAGDDGPIVFHNVDTLLYDRDLSAIEDALREADGWIDVFDADSAAYSYVALDADGKVTRIAEKVVISRHATTGLYGFRSASAYLAARAATAWAGNERYISDVYRTLLAAGAVIRVGGGRTLVLGTPAEYEAACRT